MSSSPADSVLTYISDPARGFRPSHITALRDWCTALDVDRVWQLIRRNFDRECRRDDIDHAVYGEYLRRLAEIYTV